AADVRGHADVLRAVRSEVADVDGEGERAAALRRIGRGGGGDVEIGRRAQRHRGRAGGSAGAADHGDVDGDRADRAGAEGDLRRALAAGDGAAADRPAVRRAARTG